MIKRIKLIRQNGYHIGTVPYGYQLINRKLVENKEEMRIIKLIINKYGELRKYKLVEEYINENKVLKRNVPWSISSIKYIIKKHNINNQLKKMKL